MRSMAMSSSGPIRPATASIARSSRSKSEAARQAGPRSRAAAAATELAGTVVEIFGFDSGSGMPAPADLRDAPWLIEPSYFKMDEKALRSRLTSAQLVLGDVAETVPAWTESSHPPIGFVAFDLDYYTSTVEALRVLAGDAERLIPRILCYFDDVFGFGGRPGSTRSARGSSRASR